MQLLDDLAARQLIYQETDARGLREHLLAPRKVYAGFDPSKPSLTIGNLLPIVQLARFQRAGHTPVVVVGGGTGLIGDPSGKSEERRLLSAEDVAANVAAQRQIYQRLLDFSGSNAAQLFDNAEWLCRLGFVQALRDIGKHFSVNAMIQKDSVRERLGREQGLSYTEFSYPLLQAYDFLHLYDTQGVTVQIAGSDQWGNIVSGLDLIRRTRQAQVFGLTLPLVTKADGTKFGKTESGAVWLSAELTSPYGFYQFWLNSADTEIPKYLRFYSLLPLERVEELIAAQHADPGARPAQRALAAHLTELLHGPSALAEVEAVSRALFSGEVAGLSRQTLEDVFASAPASELPRASLEGQGKPLVDFLVEAGVTKSKREARELLSTNAILVNGRRATLDGFISTEWLLYGEMALVRRGKKTWHVVRAR